MLIQFRFKNYKSFRDDTILDLTATKIKDFEHRVVRLGNERLLPAAAIFGANASGKSNVIDAFRFMTNYVLKSFSFGGDSEDKKGGGSGMKRTPFLFDSASKAGESSFEVFFMDAKEKTVNYGFTLNQSGIIEEWLSTKAKSAREFRPIFYRNGNTLDLSGLPVESQKNIKVALERETLVVSLGAKLRVTKLRAIRNWFYNNNVANFGDPFENAFLSSTVSDDFVANKAVQEKVIQFLSSFDPSITGFRIEELPADGEEKRLKIDTVHQMTDGGSAAIPLEEESDGTLKMFALYPDIQDSLDNGSVFFVDELNARLHPLLVRNILITFLNPETNPGHAQIVFTTHDSWQLSNHLLRRDEIWFTEKDAQGVSSLYSLADFSDPDGAKIRKDESFGKNYLLGKYGAIPTLKALNFLREA